MRDISMKGRPWWVPEDGPGQRPPVEQISGGLERRAVAVDAELVRAAAGEPPEPERFGPETVGETLERLGFEDLEP